MSFGFGFGFPKADTAAAGGVPGGGASLRLNFLDSTTLDPRVTFSRTSNATVFDNTGELIYAPHNLMPNSESFDNAAWTKSNAVVTANAAVAPDGTTTADLLISTGADGYVGRSLAGISGGLTYVGSMYLRSDTPVSVRLYLVETAGGSNVQLATCNVTTSWQRFSVSITTGTAVTSLALQVGGAFSFSANETVYAWGAQLNVANAPGDNLLTFSEQFDNAAWTKTNSSIQSNLLTFSEQFDNAVWTKTRSFIQTNQVRNNTMQGAVAGSPGTTPTNWIGVGAGLGTLTQTIVGTGTVNGINYIDYRINGTTSTTSYGLGFDGFTQIVASVGQIWTSSVYVARVGGSTTNFVNIFQRLINRDAAGVNLGSDSIDLIPTLSTTLTRVPLTRTLAGVGTAYVSNDILFAFTSGVAIDITLRIGWPQLVLGAVAGDPVPTYGAAAAVMYAAPGGSITADKLSEDTQTGVHAAAQGVTVSAGALVTASVYIKAAERTQWLVILDDGTGINFAQIDHAGSVSSGGSASGVTGSVTAAGDGWSRFVITCAPTASYTTARLRIAPLLSGSISYTGDGTSGIYIWGAQLVQGTVPYDYVRTDATPVAIGYSAPDATMTADKLVENTATSTHQTFQSYTVTSGLTYTYSAYAKATERAQIAVNLSSGASAFAAAAQVIVDLTNGAVVSGVGTVTSLSGGWYRISVSNTAIATAAADAVLRISVAGNTSYTGDGVSGVLIWGAQLNLGATALPYVETTNSIYPTPSYNDTTVQNLLGYTQEFDNAAWAKSNSFIQTNQIRNNTMQGAVAGTPGTLPTNWSVFTSLTGLSREVVGTGIENGIAYIDVRVSGTPSAAAGYNFYTETATGVAALSGQTWTVSGFFKLQAGSLAGITSTRLFFQENNSIGGYLIEQNTAISAPTAASLVSQRSSATRTLTNASTAFLMPGFNLLLTGAAIDITLRIGWPQLVQGAVAGDPVATYGTALPVQYVAPDGSVTGDKWVENVGAGAKQLFQTVNWLNGTRSAWSIYAKAAERGFLYFSSSATVFPSGGVLGYVNLNTGATSSVGANCTITATSVGNGWWRCCLIATPGATATNPGIDIRISANGSDAGAYTGDGTSGIFIWGAQLSDSASLDPYVYNPVAAPTAAAYYGPRFDYDPATLAPRGLLIEEQRVNSIRNNTMQGAVAGTPGTAPTNWDITSSGTGISREIVGTGVEDGITYIDVRFFGTGSGTAIPQIRPETTTGVVAAAGQSWAASWYLRIVGGSTTGVTGWSSIWQERDATGVALNTVTIVLSDPTTAALKTQRLTLARTLTDAGTARLTNRIQFICTDGVAVNITLRIGLPQLELGAFATGVIPTTTAAATRTADVATMVGANFSNWYRQDEGTLFVGGVIPFVGGGNFPSFASVDDGTANDAIEWSMWDAAGDSIRYVVYDNNVAQASIAPATYTANSVAKLVGAYKINDFAAAYNGGAASTDTSGTLPVVSTARIGQNRGGGNFLNGYIRQITYFPRRLANAELQGVTL